MKGRMMSEHDFKGALDNCSDGWFSMDGKEENGEVGIWFDLSYKDAITTALRIADRLQSGEVSEGVRYATHYAQAEKVNADDGISMSKEKLSRFVKEKVSCLEQIEVDRIAFKAMSQQLIKEVEGE